MQASEGAIFGVSKGAMLSTSKGANNAINKGDTTDIVGVFEGASDPLPCSLHSFTTSFADVESGQLNTQTHFDADSIFFVCDNLTTGHICNNIQKFIPGTLRQTNKSLTTANGTGPCFQEGTICLRLQDDMGTEHVFILDNCLYQPNSLVNLLSTRRLAEKFINENGNPDKETQIESQYSSHVLTWSFGHF
jgi:hypothetical protein